MSLLIFLEANSPIKNPLGLFFKKKLSEKRNGYLLQKFPFFPVLQEGSFHSPCLYPKIPQPASENQEMRIGECEVRKI